MRILASTFVLLALGATALACDDLNRPMAVPHSEARHGCFTDVECPSNMKCWKGPQDVQGICEPRNASDPAPAAGAGDAGIQGSDAGVAPGEVKL